MLRSFGRKSRWWLALVQVALLLLTVVTPAAAAPNLAPLSDPQPLSILQTYGIVKGDPTGNLNLDKPITRAEMITIMVRSIGGERDALLLAGLSVFSDTKGHWAEAYISFASTKGLVKGDGNGLVRPNDRISYGEAMTLILRVLGQEPPSGEWPSNVLIASAKLGILPTGINLLTIRDDAVRGVVFQSLGFSISTIKSSEGKTVLQTYVDLIPPTVTLDSLGASTKESTAHVTGTIKDAVSVTVNGSAATITGGTFTAVVPLDLGNNQITVTALDLAGNPARATATLTRVPPITALTITGPSKVRPNGTATYVVSGTDSSGNTVVLTGVTASVSGNIGTFNLATGVLTAAATATKGTITLSAGQVSKSIDVEVMGQNSDATRLNIRQVNGGRATAYTKPMTVTIEVLNANGQLLDSDYGRPITLAANGLQGLTVSPALAYTEAGVATFTVTTQAMGVYNLQATSTELIGSFTAAEFGSNLRVQLSTDVSSLTIGGAVSTSRIRGTLVDENGNTVNNQTGNDITVQLYASGTDGSLLNQNLMILQGTSSSAQSSHDGLFTAGAQAGTATITGVTTGVQRITVDATSIGLTVPNIGSGSHWDLVTYQPYTPNQQGTFHVRLVDANNNTIPGNYAFQLTLGTSNNEPKVGGIPAGVTITLGNTALNPVSDGIPEGAPNNGNDVIVRTAGGSASFKITYNKPGQVFLTVIAAPGTTNAFAQDGTVGTATTVYGVPDKTVNMIFTQTPTAVKLQVDSDGLGNGVNAGATSVSRSFTLHAYLTDSNGAWTPATSATLTLTRVSGASTTVPSVLTATAVDGKADFVVYANSTLGEDIYKVGSNLTGSPFSNTVALQVQTSMPAATSIIAARGSNNGIPGALNYVAPTDTGLEIELAQDLSQHWAVVKVYPENGYTALYISAPVDLTSGAPRIVIPKSALPSGITRYQVTLRNGYGEGARSLSTNQVTNSVLVNNFSITSAKYQRATKQMTIYGTGFTTTTDIVNPALITVRDSSTGQIITLASAQVTVNNWNQITLNLTGLTGVTNALENPAKFSGSDVGLTAAAGWYTRSNGEQSSAITSVAPVGPMATLQYVVYDRVNSRMYLNGDGFNSVNIDFTKLKLQALNATDILLSGFTTTRINDNQWVVNLNSSTLAALDATGTYTLSTLDGWAYDSTWTEAAMATSLPMYAQVSLSSVTYTRLTHKLKLMGGGFLNGTATIGNLQLVDKDTNQTVTLSGAWSVASDAQIDFTLDNAAITVFENPTLFGLSDNIYLVGSASWFTNAALRPAAAIPDRTLRLSQQ